MEDTAQQQVFHINEIALCIFGYVLGDDANEIKSKLGEYDNDIENLPCVSSLFRTCFLRYLRSTPLKFSWRDNDISVRGRRCNEDYGRYITPRNRDAVRWMKRNDVTIYHLEVDLQWILERHDWRLFVDAFTVFDLSTLVSLDINIHWADDSYDYHSDDEETEVREFYSLFSQVTSLAHLSIHDTSWRSSQITGEAWSCHPKLKSLKIEGNFADYFFKHAQSFTELERLACGGFFADNITFASQTLIAINLTYCDSDISIDSLTCPSLEEFIFRDNVTIGGKCSSDLMKEFGNSNRDFITTFWVTYRHLMCNAYYDESSIDCVAIVPAHIISSDMIQVPSKCRFILVKYD